MLIAAVILVLFAVPVRSYCYCYRVTVGSSNSIPYSQRELVGTKKILPLSVWRDRFPVQGHVTIVRESFFTRLGTFPLYRSARLCLRTGQSFISKEMPVSCMRAHLLQHTKMPHQRLSHSLEDNLLE